MTENADAVSERGPVDLMAALEESIDAVRVARETRPVGYQADGSYVACPECGWEPMPRTRRERELDEFSTAIPVMPRTPGTAIHEGDCPLVALPKDVAEKLYADLAEMDRVRRRGAAEAANYVIG